MSISFQLSFDKYLTLASLRGFFASASILTVRVVASNVLLLR